MTTHIYSDWFLRNTNDLSTLDYETWLMCMFRSDMIPNNLIIEAKNGSEMGQKLTW